MKVIDPPVLALVTNLAFLVDGIEPDTLMKTVVHHFGELFASQVAFEECVIVTIRTAVRQMGMVARKFSRIEEAFVATFLKSDDGRYSRGEGNEANEKES